MPRNIESGPRESEEEIVELTPEPKLEKDPRKPGKIPLMSEKLKARNLSPEEEERIERALSNPDHGRGTSARNK